MMERPHFAAAGTALVVSQDEPSRRLIVESLQLLAIRPEMCEETFSAAGFLAKQKFEAVIVDSLLGDEARLIMELVRLSRANRTAVTFAVTAGEERRTLDARVDAMFALQRPLSADTVNQTLRAAYGLIVRERRRYFRCPMAVPAFVRAGQQEELMYQTVNVSEGGIAISARARVDSDLPAAVRFTLPERSTQLLAETRVRWRNAGGLVGLEFISLALPHKTELQEWLARKLDETLPENVAALFRTVGRS
jgi:hypothetical protein